MDESPTLSSSSNLFTFPRTQKCSGSNAEKLLLDDNIPEGSRPISRERCPELPAAASLHVRNEDCSSV